ncbi:pyridoxal phosphate-dependent transferase [Gamsiella multidivaricata]|uniref:pyridoxal phosphate-dependent transferase n=1 Tax=Gamsiella multidivaricata TaxID=101098 RepID=UPI002220B61F|nr:pyridoxal phosphate-dependent transferase [Gamsiella multidivaricata]KAG0357215.1 hypothetical protein BGZ54_000410 [Gamsiella multidivaricata]KAI7832723.1 pyridoxal phosphate-dependent transferase [Gamsiella multidivaricata]
MALPDDPKTIARLLEQVAQHAAGQLDCSTEVQRHTLPLRPFPAHSAQFVSSSCKESSGSTVGAAAAAAGTGAGSGAGTGTAVGTMDEETRAFLKQGLSEHGSGLEKTVEELLTRIGPSLANSAGPRYFGLVTGGVTPAALLADWVVSTYDQNTILWSDEQTSGYSLITELGMRMLVQLFDLPLPEQVGGRDGNDVVVVHSEANGDGDGGHEESKGFRAMTTTGSTASNIVGMAAGRQWLGIYDRDGTDYAQDGYDGQVVVVTNMAHASVWKAASILGIGRKQVVEVPEMGMGDSEEDEREEALESKVKELKERGKSVLVFLAFGEVNTGIFPKNTRRIAEICRKYNAYFHIDGAFGIYARCSPKYAHLADGLELAHSITACGHKWLNVPYDCGLFLYRSSLETAILEPIFSSTAAYLRPSGTSFSHPMNISIENSQRFRALPVWATLHAYGREGYCRIVEENCRFAKRMFDWMKVERCDLFEVLTEECPLNIVVFAGISLPNRSQEGGGEREKEVLERRNAKLLRAINETGVAYFSPTVWKGRAAIRAAISNWKTTVERDWEPVRAMLEEQGEKILREEVV